MAAPKRVSRHHKREPAPVARSPLRRRLAMSRLSLCCVILAATTAGLAHSDNPGFFQPTPDGDVALTKIVPPRDESTAPPAAVPPSPAPAVAAADAAAAQRQRED